METSLSNKSYEMAPEVKKAWVAIALLIIIEIAAASFGYDGRKIFQITALLTPTLLLLLVPIKSNHINLIRQVFVWIIFLIFILDSIVRIHLFSNYDAAPDSSMIVGAVANTNKEEVREYIFSQSRYFWASLSIFLIIALFSFKITQQGIRNKHRSSKIHKFILILAICISMVAYASKPWRRINPFIFWSQFVESAIETKESWRTYDQARKDALELAKGKNPEVERMGSSTIVLVISESINRDNMSLYGYERQTTPNLKSLQSSLGNNFFFIKNAWSTEATTIPSLDSMMNFKSSNANEKLNLIALAKAAGYKTWWISNHDDIAVAQKLAAFSDVVVMENNKPGRSSNSLDEVLLPPYEAALQDLTPRKLIILHMLGAHPHYRLRFPNDQNSFNEDSITRKMAEAEKPAWVREFRNEYDSAILYQDKIVGSIFEKATSSNFPSADFRSVVYVSDHGQEVGHSTNRVGHSPSTESGYKIPAVFWVSDELISTSQEMSNISFRADWLAWTVSDLLSLKWDGKIQSRNIFSKEYKFHPPEIKSSMTEAIKH
ncbi:phosphoethanolamine transferase [Comamonas thiooxydans]|uniref:phosphoethanolamine transferase n=1 Tax=Comamonas thiooxydans TaxID=363952 RepID=UPI000A2D536A|nr:phosphoethanolamine transferase [Comamonas thiooxydans]BDR09404.1 phosphoethanolamine transferase [Comamonas thiooxydans]